MLANKNLAGIFNLCTAKARSFNELAHAVLKSLDKKPILEYFDMPDAVKANYQYFTQADNMKLIQAGYKNSFWELEAAVEDYINAYLVKDDPYCR